MDKSNLGWLMEEIRTGLDAAWFYFIPEYFEISLPVTHLHSRFLCIHRNKHSLFQALVL